MGICTSKPSPEPNLSDHHDAIRAKGNLTPLKATPKPPNNLQTPSNHKQGGLGNKSHFFPFYSPSPAHFLFSKKSPARSPANASSNSTPKRFFRRPFPPPSPAKHIKALWARRHSSVKPNEAAIPEGDGVDSRGVLDKSFGFSKHFEKRYEVGDEVGRGHFGYTCKAKCRKGDLKGQEVAVKVIPKVKVLTFDL